jgi:hypothetical protein
MWNCPKCQAEVDEPLEICWSCGTSRDGVEDPGFHPEVNGIMDSDVFEAERKVRAQENLVTLATFWTGPEAHVCRAQLEAQGIRAIVLDELATTMTWGLLSDHGGVKVLVPEKDLEEARRVLAASGGKKAEPRPQHDDVG